MNAERMENDILIGLNPSFVGQLKKLAVESLCSDKGVLFRQGDSADHFFTLVQGKVALCLGEQGHAIYKVESAGEAFGWSSLTGCSTYTASAVCLTDSKILRYDGAKLKALLAGQPDESLKFYQNLSRTLDNRLHQSYDLLSSIAASSDKGGDQRGQVKDPFELL